MVRHPKTFLFYDAVRVRVLKSTYSFEKSFNFMQRKRELKFYATNTHQFPLILDAWLPRRGGETTWTNLQTKIFLFWGSRTHKTIHFFEEVSLEKN